MPAGNQLTHPRSYNSPGAPTWASVARGEGACTVKNIRPLQQPAVSAADFTALYERCLVSGLKACVVFSHAAGCQTLSLSCTFPVPAGSTVAAGKRRRRHRHSRRRGQGRSRAATAAPEVPVPATSPSAASTAVQTLQSAMPVLSPENAPPPMKKPRK
jgi:hypothetical protein